MFVFLLVPVVPRRAAPVQAPHRAVQPADAEADRRVPAGRHHEDQAPHGAGQHPILQLECQVSHKHLDNS